MGHSETCEAGFSVLEAIVAMALLAAAFLPLLALQGQFVQSVRAVERAEIRSTAQRNAVAYLKNLNFSRFPSGNEVIGDIRIEWHSSPGRPRQSTWFNEESEGRYNVTLYRVNVSVLTEEGGIERFEMNGMGWSAKWDAL